MWTSGWGVVSGASSARAISSTSSIDDRVASSMARWTSIRIGSAAATQRGATTRRERRAIPRSIASMPTSSGLTRAIGRRISAPRLAAAVPKPRRTMSVSSSAKYATPTRAPLGASSIRSVFASASTPAFDAE